MTKIDVGELVYEYTVNITGLTEYGVRFDALMAGAVAPPPEGARFDVAFEGASHGPRLTGTLRGVDYVRVRADGRFELHIHGELTTDDGQKISLHADGVAVPTADPNIAELRENVTLSTSAEEHRWVNARQFWGVGTVDLGEQVVHIRGYAV